MLCIPAPPISFPPPPPPPFPAFGPIPDCPCQFIKANSRTPGAETKASKGGPRRPPRCTPLGDSSRQEEKEGTATTCSRGPLASSSVSPEGLSYRSASHLTVQPSSREREKRDTLCRCTLSFWRRRRWASFVWSFESACSAPIRRAAPRASIGRCHSKSNGKALKYR